MAFEVPMRSCGSTGTDSSVHLACELLAQRAGIDMIDVAYKGGGQAITDGVLGQIPLVCTAIATSQQFLNSGRLKGIGVSSAIRSGAAPEVPIFAERGFPDLVMYSGVGILAPAKTPRAIVGRCTRKLSRCCRCRGCANAMLCSASIRSAIHQRSTLYDCARTWRAGNLS